MTSQRTDVLFAISDTGGGHRSAAVAISAALDELSEGTVSWRIDDILKQTDVPGLRGAPDLYDRLSTRWLRLYDLTFQLTNDRRTVDLITQMLLVIARRNIVKLMLETRPRVVVVTHPLTIRFVCAARRAYRIPCRIITTVTDLVSLHASWTYSGVDLCAVPTQEAYQVMMKRNMRPDRLVRTGFPVHPKFIQFTKSVSEARRELGLDPERFTILLTSGGVGSGNLHGLVLSLERAYPGRQILIVTGKNKALYQELNNERRPRESRVYGFVNNMEALMAASDVVVTKAGPGTLMEALVMQRPVVVTEAVGMQERGNIDFVLNHELGYYCPTSERIINAIGELSDPHVLAATIARVGDSVTREGAYQIARIALDQMALIDVNATPRPQRRNFISLEGALRIRRPFRRKRG
jgi:UDP-N-acetylglucosamine:LPS N-acetylglucosamine transferase